MKTSKHSGWLNRYELPKSQLHALAQKTLSEIQKLGVDANPVHYLIIFEWLSKIDPFMAEQIDLAIKFKSYDNHTAEQLFNELASIISQKTLPSDAFTAMVSDLLLSMNHWLSTSKQNNEDIEKQLTQISKDLADQNVTPELIDQIRQMIIPKLQSQMTETQRLTDCVQETQHEVQRLKKELDKVTSISLTDELTNIPNRRGFNQLIKDVINEAQAIQKSFVILIVDIDHFKKINDTYGHLLGDSILRYLAKFLHHEIKGKDFIARIGGEEFVIVLTEANYQNGIQVANNLREKLSQRKLQVKNETQKLTITVSAGVGVYQMGETFEALFDRADKALYLAKNKGRNRVCGETDL